MTALLIALKYWKAIAGALGVLVILGLLWGIYDAGRDAERAAHKAAQAQVQINTLAKANERLQNAAAWDRNQALQNAAEAQELATKLETLDEYISTLPSRDAECLSGPDVGRLQRLWD